MRTHEPIVIAESNFSRAWARAFQHTFANPHDAGPMAVSFRLPASGEAEEDTTLRRAVASHWRNRRSSGTRIIVEPFAQRPKVASPFRHSVGRRTALRAKKSCVAQASRNHTIALSFLGNSLNSSSRRHHGLQFQLWPGRFLPSGSLKPPVPVRAVSDAGLPDLCAFDA